MSYIDFFMAPVPRANRAAYEALARISAEVVKEHGALGVVECWLDESGPDAASYHGVEARRPGAQYAGFAAAAGAGHDETVVLSWVEWPDKAARDAGMEKVTSDPRMRFGDQPAAFDGARLVAAGFKPMPLGGVGGGGANAQAHAEVELRGWRPGASAVSATQAIKAHSTLSLAAAKAAVEDCLSGRSARVQATDAAAAHELVSTLAGLGFDAKVSSGDQAL